jgi:hypothetical protein
MEGKTCLEQTRLRHHSDVFSGRFEGLSPVAKWVQRDAVH